MKKFISMACALALTLSFLSGALPQAAATEATPKATGTTYYVSDKGAGGNDGLSAANPFAGLDAVSWDTLQPGDSVLLEKGSTFDGFIHLVNLRGTKENPIKIGTYANAANATAGKPVINGKGQGIWYQDYGQALDNGSHKYRGYVSSTILLYDCDFIEVSGLEITNTVPNEKALFQPGEEQTMGAGIMDRTGVAGAAKNGGTMEHIYLDDLYIHDVSGNIQDKHMDNGGIQLNALKPANEAATGIARYDDVKITNCTVENVSRAGICVGYTYQWARFNGASIADSTAKTYGHTNLYIGNNYVKDAGNDAIVALYAYAPLVERNIADGAGKDLPIYQAGGWQQFCAGIWPWKCKDAIFQYNEVFDTVGEGNGDGQAFDVDWSDGAIYQYNYSHNNGMGPILFCLNEATNGVYRYNLSQDDLGCYMTLQGNPNAKIYNNVFYSGADKGVRILHAADSKNNGNAWIANNIFYSVDPQTVTAESWAGKGGTKTYTNNLYYNFSVTPVGDTNQVVPASGTAVFVDPGKAPTATTTPGIISARTDFVGFKLAQNSPAIKAGVLVENNGEKDFFGDLLDNTPDIGIHNVFEHVPESDNRIKSAIFEVRGENIMVPLTALSQPTVEDLLNGVTVAKTATKKMTAANDAPLTGTEVLSAGMKLVVTAEDTTLNTYTVVAKNEYNYVTDFVGNQQGNVWFAQTRQSDGSYTNIMQWQEEWKSWGDYAAPYRAVGVDGSPSKGLICDSMAGSRSEQSQGMAFRAPTSGVVELRFADQPTLRNVNNVGTATLVLTKNGTTLPGRVYTLPNDKTSLNIAPINLTLVAGDVVRLEAINVGTSFKSTSFHITPVFTYLEAAPTISTDAYLIDEVAKTITNVEFGTAKATFLNNVTVAEGTSVTLVNASDTTEVADGATVLSGMRLEVTVGEATPLYYVITVLAQVPSSYQELSRAGWTATAGSAEPTAGLPSEGPAGLALDGNPGTRWHTLWSGANIANAWIAIDMKEPKQVGRIGYQARAAQNAGNIYDYVVETSADGAAWTEISSGSWSKAAVDGDRTVVHYATFEAVTTQYIRLRAIRSEENHGCATEIYVAAPVYD